MRICCCRPAVRNGLKLTAAVIVAGFNAEISRAEVNLLIGCVEASVMTNMIGDVFTASSWTGHFACVGGGSALHGSMTGRLADAPLPGPISKDHGNWSQCTLPEPSTWCSGSVCGQVARASTRTVNLQLNFRKDDSVNLSLRVRY